MRIFWLLALLSSLLLGCTSPDDASPEIEPATGRLNQARELAFLPNKCLHR